MSDFLSHLVSSALGTGHPVQPVFSPQAPAPEAAPAPELPRPPLAPPPASSFAPSLELQPPRVQPAVPRVNSVPGSIPDPSPVSDPLPFIPGAESVNSVRSTDSAVEEEESPPPAAAGGAEGRARDPERPVALRHVPHPASPAARERGTEDAELDSEPVERQEPVTPEALPRRERVPSLSEPIHAAKSMDRERQEPTSVAKNPRREPQEPIHAAQSTNRESQELINPVQSPIRNRAETPSESQRPFRTEEDPRPARPAFTDSAGESDRQDAPSAVRPPSEPQRRLNQAPERRRIEREVSAPPAAPPPVQIRIGRVEVRAVRPGPSAAPVPAPAPAPAAPATSLTDYLRKQRGRS